MISWPMLRPRWYREDYSDDVVTILRVQHYLAPAAYPDGTD
ncbi:hypothetical protein PV733_22490 [Streptomyces europaeiscabiei]|nr:hypothetical protein [Streptomyces europaeiscabiei]MDX3711665.1 hypothetical protein [Streptomyces europaeiscabiei]